MKQPETPGALHVQRPHKTTKQQKGQTRKLTRPVLAALEIVQTKPTSDIAPLPNLLVEGGARLLTPRTSVPTAILHQSSGVTHKNRSKVHVNDPMAAGTSHAGTTLCKFH